MLETTLAKELVAFLEEALVNTWLPLENGGGKPPQIIDGFLPPKSKNDDFPFVIVRPESGTSDRGRTTVTVSLIIGCYSEELDGYGYCVEVMQRIRAALATFENQTLANRFQLEFPITWQQMEEQPYPLWLLNMTTKWTFNTPQLTNF